MFMFAVGLGSLVGFETHLWFFFAFKLINLLSSNKAEAHFIYIGGFVQFLQQGIVERALVRSQLIADNVTSL